MSPYLIKLRILCRYDRYNAMTDELGLLSGIRDRRYAELDTHVNISWNVNFLSDLNNVLKRILPHKPPTAYKRKEADLLLDVEMTRDPMNCLDIEQAEETGTLQKMTASDRKRITDEISRDNTRARPDKKRIRR